MVTAWPLKDCLEELASIYYLCFLKKTVVLCCNRFPNHPLKLSPVWTPNTLFSPIQSSIEEKTVWGKPMPSNQQIWRQAIGKSTHTSTEAGKLQPTESFKDTLGQSGKLSIAVINWEAARAEGGSGTQQSAIGWLGSHKNITLIIQPEMKDHEWLGVARALNQAAHNTRISARGSRSQAILHRPSLGRKKYH